MLDDRTVDPTLDDPGFGCGTPPATASAGRPTWAAPIRTSPCRPAARISPGCHPRGSEWGRWTSCTPKICPTPPDSGPPVSPAEFTRLPGRSTVSTGCCPKLDLAGLFRRQVREPAPRRDTGRVNIVSTALSREQRDLSEAVAALMAARSSESDVRRLMAESTGGDATTWAQMAAMGLVGLIIPEGSAAQGPGRRNSPWSVRRWDGRCYARLPVHRRADPVSASGTG